LKLSPVSDFSKTKSAVQHGIERRLHTGVQIYVSVAGQCLLNAGFGMAAVKQPMTASTMMLWRSAGKPLTSAAILKMCEQGRASLDTTLADVIPATRGLVISAVTIRQLLSHASGLPLIETGWPHCTWNDTLTRIYRIGELKPGSAYQPQSTWFLLGEILQCLDSGQRSFNTILTEDLLAPIGINDVWCGLADDHATTLNDRLPEFTVAERSAPRTSDYSVEPWLTRPSPGGNLRGPIRELGRFYEVLLNQGVSSSGRTVLRSETVATMTSAHRTGMFDETMQHIVDLGLGLFLDSNRYGTGTVPYGFGKYCSVDTFGHGGAQCAMAFCDPVHKLVVAWAANGFCSEPQHQRRNRAINEAVYEDLSLFI
jgi:CubicO group peptidase (beta-lactamase class C family)